MPFDKEPLPYTNAPLPVCTVVACVPLPVVEAPILFNADPDVPFMSVTGIEERGSGCTGP